MFDWVQQDWWAQLSAAVQVLIAVVLGSIVGYEREVTGRPAGLRTHALLAGAAALLVLLAEGLVLSAMTETGPTILRVDPVRIIEAIIVGTSFLGAGTIFRRRNEGIVGLTTGASLLLVAGIGIAVAVGKVLLALLMSMLGLLVLRGLWHLEQRRDAAASQGKESGS